jgi:hypothetical protein
LQCGESWRASNLAERRKWLIIALPLVLTIVGVFATVFQGIESKRASDGLRTALNDNKWIGAENTELLKEINRINAENTNLEKENTDLQKQLLAQSKTTVDVSSESLGNAIGGHSFCYVSIAMNSVVPADALEIAMVGKGRYPLSQVRVRIDDLDAAEKSGVSRPGKTVFFNPSPARYTGFYRRIKVIEHVPESVSRKRFNIFMSARNGAFTEILRMARVAGVWLSATRVTASYYDRTRGLVLDEVPKSFPSDALGDKDWIEAGSQKRLKVE